MRSKTKIFFLRLILLLAVLVVLDQAIGRVLQHYYLKVRSGSVYKTVYAIEQSREDLLVLGSSRAYHHYIPALLQLHLGLESYNLGRDGAGTLYNYAVYQTICERKKPRVVIVDINPEEFIAPNVSYQLLNQLLPHYDKNATIREVVALRSRSESFKAQSWLYRFNSQPFYIAVNNIQHTGTDPDKGYLPMSGYIKGRPRPADKDNGAIDTLLVRYFEKFLAQAKGNGTRVVVCVSPVYRRYPRRTTSMEQAARLCERYAVPFLDFSQDTAFLQHPELFRDMSHLNGDGAQHYTQLLIAALSHYDFGVLQH